MIIESLAEPANTYVNCRKDSISPKEGHDAPVNLPDKALHVGLIVVESFFLELRRPGA